MKERPILFSTPMVEAIQNDRKTQTRRMMKPQPDVFEYDGMFAMTDKSARWGAVTNPTYPPCPYGKVGDRLWVREKTRIVDWNDEGEVVFQYADGTKSEWRQLYSDESDYDGEKYMEWWGRYCNRLESLGAKTDDYGQMSFDGVEFPWKPSIHMPRSACRIILEITDVLCERLQEISEQDAISEGVETFRPVPGGGPAETMYRHYLKENKWGPSPVHSFQTLWQLINGHDSWAANPWIWAISFKRIQDAGHQ